MTAPTDDTELLLRLSVLARECDISLGTDGWIECPTVKLIAFAQRVAGDAASLCDAAADKEISPYAGYHESDADAIRVKYGLAK